MSVIHLGNLISKEGDAGGPLAKVTSQVFVKAANTLILRVDLKDEVFRISVKEVDGLITVTPDNGEPRSCTTMTILRVVASVIDMRSIALSARKSSIPNMSDKAYPPSYYDLFDMSAPVLRSGPPKHMDIPVWDEEKKRWYDAEY